MIGLAQLLLFAAMAGAPPAAAVTASASTGDGACRVVAAGSLPRGVTREDICSAIARAMAAQAPGVRYGVEVQILSSARLSASLTVGGKALPRQHMAVSDAKISISSINRFANALAAAAARAAAL